MLLDLRQERPGKMSPLTIGAAASTGLIQAISGPGLGGGER